MVRLPPPLTPPLPPPRPFLLPLPPPPSRLVLIISAKVAVRSGPMYLPPSISMRMGSTKNGTVSLGSPSSSKYDTFVHLFSYRNYLSNTSYKNGVARCGYVIIPCNSFWSSYSLSMGQRSSTTAAACRPPAEKRCDATKTKVPKSRSASSTDGMTARQTCTAVLN